MNKQSWQEKYAHKLRTAEEAVKVVKSGDKVAFCPMTIPETLAKSLADRWEELKNVTVECTGSLASLYGLLDPKKRDSFHIHTQFALNPAEVQGIVSGDPQIDYDRSDFCISRLKVDEREEMDWLKSDVCFTCVSPPNVQGYCSFGHSVFLNTELINNAKVVIAEVDPDLIRTPGQNFIHIDQIEYLVEKVVLIERCRNFIAASMDRNDYEIACANAVGPLLGTIVKDGDCLELGGGNLPMWSIIFLDHLHDLGVHTESFYPGMITLLKKGVITCKRKNFHPGKVVCTGLWPEPGDKDFCDNNPMIEMYPITYVNNILNIARNDNMVAINPAMAIDLVGHIAIERVGDRFVRGAGGALNFPTGALYAKNGRSIHLIPATNPEKTRSHIVAEFPRHTVVNIPPAMADYVITEFGVARLLGKSVRERAEELIAVAHPDFRSDLKEAAKKMF